MPAKQKTSNPKPRPKTDVAASNGEPQSPVAAEREAPIPQVAAAAPAPNIDDEIELEPIPPARQPEPAAEPPRAAPPRISPAAVAPVAPAVSTDAQVSSAVRLFQTAHGRMVMLQRLDAQLTVVLEQRQKLQSDLSGLQVQINDEFDRVARNAEDALGHILS